MRFWALVIGLIAPLTFGADPTNAPSANTLETLRPKYEAMLKEIGARFDKDLTELPPKYLKAVDAVQLDAQSKGDLQGVVAAKKESTQFALSNTVPPEDETDLAPAIKTLRGRYRQQAQQFAAKRDKDIVILVQQYCGRLAVLEKQLTIDGKIDAALGVRAEAERVKTSKEAQAAIIATYSEPAGSANPDGTAAATPPPATPPPPKSELAASLATGTVPEFGFTDGDARQKAEVLNRLAAALSTRGVRMTIGTGQIQVDSVSYDQGLPRYHCPYVPDNESGRRNKNYTLTEVTPLAALQTACAFLGVGYRLDAANHEAILVDDFATNAEWALETTAPDQILKDMATVDGKKRYVGKTVLVTGNTAATMQGLGEVSITLTNRIRLTFPRTSANIKRVGDIQTQTAAATKANRESPYARRTVEVTVMGRVTALSTSLQLTLDDCVLLDSCTGTSYGTVTTPGQRITRIDDRPTTRNIHRIGE